MTEMYHGPWDPVTGDKPGKRVEDPYHPQYPDCGPYTKVEGILNGNPISGAYRLRAVDVSAPAEKGN